MLPPSQMDIGLQTVGLLDSARIVEVSVRVNNKGSSALVITDLRIRLRYPAADDEIKVINDPNHPAFGRLNFPHAHVLHDVGAAKRCVKRPDRTGRKDAEYQFGSGEFLLIQYDTFVQPGVDQSYTFVTALPKEAKYVLTRASFRYEMQPSKMQAGLLRISRKLGIHQYSLDHVSQPHTIEKSLS